ncbi:MAG: cation transporter [Atopobiaceae bacterium]|nr:cation transporter [Atopobiaceae bacterium]
MSDESVALDRERQIVRTSYIGIAGNVVLAAFKAAVGGLTGSIAIVLDAVNNLSDALSSLITIIGTRLASRPADRNHPFGYGRIEYMSAIVIASIVLAAGVTSLRESVTAIIEPSVPSYDMISILILVVAVIAKVILGRYFIGVGRRVSSDSLIASGTDATMDAAISSATVIAALLYLTLGISVEAWLGALISVVIIKSGIEMLQETLSKILGERVDAEVSRKVKEVVESFDGVGGAYDLFLYDYGPERMQGSIHIAVDENMTAAAIDALTKAIQERVIKECGVILVAVGVYATNAADSPAGIMRSNIANVVWSHEHVKEMHGFYVDEDKKSVRFDVVIGFEDPDRQATRDLIVEQCRQAYPDYEFTVFLDTDVSD